MIYRRIILWNSCEFIGYLGKDPETKVAKSGKSFTTFSIGVNKPGASRDDKALWINVIAFDKNGENAALYLKKGSLTLVQGSIELNEWEGPDGKTRTTLQLVASRVVFLPSGKHEESETKTATAPAKTVTVDDNMPF